MLPKSKIAILMDENTSKGGTHYELNKDYVNAIVQAGGLPYLIPYITDLAPSVIAEFDGFYNVGGNICFPADWLSPGHANLFPESERLQVETTIMRGFLAAQKPILGSCHGMQVLAGLNGCTLRCDVAATHRHPDLHAHRVTIHPGTQLHRHLGVDSLTVNSRHSQAVATLSPGIAAGATAPDSVIEAIEVTGHPFAIGLQWHPENFWREDTPGNRIFTAFIAACT